MQTAKRRGSSKTLQPSRGRVTCTKNPRASLAALSEQLGPGSDLLLLLLLRLLNAAPGFSSLRELKEEENAEHATKPTIGLPTQRCSSPSAGASPAARRCTRSDHTITDASVGAGWDKHGSLSSEVSLRVALQAALSGDTPVQHFAQV